MNALTLAVSHAPRFDVAAGAGAVWSALEERAAAGSRARLKPAGTGSGREDPPVSPQTRQHQSQVRRG
jgi:hypothetical protein